MILLFHLITSVIYNLFKNITESDFNVTKPKSDHPLAQRDAENDIKFDPPVFKQRYERATEILIDPRWKNHISKVVDFGCSEFGLFVFLKNKVQVRELFFVDVDELLLRDYLYRVYPLNADHLIGREHPLTVSVYVGSVSNPDPNLLNTDAVVALEIIEHLYPDILEPLPYNFFSYIRPKLAIFTTPNAEFNVLFEKLGKFRHADHKFEWSREQFESWAENITLRFPEYTVYFDGIGLGPPGSEHLGCCSQLALFLRKDIICDNFVEIHNNCLPKYSHGVCTYESHSQKVLAKYMCGTESDNYKLVARIEYPVKIDSRTEEEKILDEVKYRIHLFGSHHEEYYNDDKNRLEIPLKCLVYKTSGPFPTEKELRALLIKFNYQIEECFNAETNQLESCVIYEPEMESGGSSSDTEASGYGSDSNKYNTDDTQLSDWDEKDLTSWDNLKSNEGQAIKTQLHLEVSSSKKPQGALFDSGYQKSPEQAAIPLEFKSLNSEKPNKLSNILSVFDHFDKINELDAVRKEKKYFNFSTNLPHREVMKKLCQEIAKHPIPGPSREVKKGKGPKKSSQSSDSEESVEDVKSVTTCILENSLNQIEDEGQQRADFIHELVQEEEHHQEPEVFEAHAVVENGDLANNNRDGEGNNYPPGNIDVEDDNPLDNLEPNNVNIDNNNEVIDEEPIQEPQPFEEDAEELDARNLEVAWSSREALFDINSQIDLLEDFEMESSGAVDDNNPVAESSSAASEAVLPTENASFPNWLLQIFEEGEVGVPEEDLHDEPHFYCQGDGLGVHPSVIVIDDDDNDDDGNEPGSDSSSSSSGSADFANAENHSIQDVFVAPNNAGLVVMGQPVGNQGSQGSEEDFENAEGSDSNLVVASTCTE